MSRAARWLGRWPHPAVLLTLAAVALVLGLIGWASLGNAGSAESGVFALSGILAGGLDHRCRDVGIRASRRGRRYAPGAQACRRGDPVDLQPRVRDGRYRSAPNFPGPLFPTAQWEAHRDVLARHLRDEVWDELSPFMDSVPAARQVFERLPKGTEFQDPLWNAIAVMTAGAANAYELLKGDPVSAFVEWDDF